MKLRTHNAIALALGVQLAVALGAQAPFVACMIYLVLLVISQILIDSIGHTWKTYRGRLYPARNKWHSLPGTIALGLLLGAPAWAFEPVLGAGIVVALLAHLAADAVTEGGIYIRGRRFRPPAGTVRYDDPWANRLAILLSWMPAPFIGGDFFASTEYAACFAVAVAYSVYAFLTA